MPEWEYYKNYYQILGVDPRATTREIRAARNRKALELHPDRLSRAPETVRQSATEELKGVNQAFEVLGNSEKRARYDAERLRWNSPPKPTVEPAILRFSSVEPGQIQTSSFVIRNHGGAYESIWVGNPGSWVSVTGCASLEADDELPLQVEITASGPEWGKQYTESIAVHLDDVEVVLTVQLQTKPAPTPGYTRQAPASVPGQPLGPPNWANWALGLGFAVFVIIIGIAVIEGSQQSDGAGSHYRPPTYQSGFNYIGSQPQAPGFQFNSPGVQPGFPNTQPQIPGYQFGSPAVQPGSSGFGSASSGFGSSSSGGSSGFSGFPSSSPATSFWP